LRRHRHSGKKGALPAIHPLNKALHPIPPQIAHETYRENHIDPRVFTHGVIPGSSHIQALGISSPRIDKATWWDLAIMEGRMEQYVGMDVSLTMTAICIVDRTGKIEREGVVASDPEAIAGFVRLHAPHVARIGLETGATSTWLWTELNKMELPVICIDARHAKAALKMQINKSDRNDAVGIARIMQCGWYKEVHVKGLDSHAIKALLASRALLVKIKRDLENQIRSEAMYCSNAPQLIMSRRWQVAGYGADA
jgi:hypothetical protein